jgi:hypothetical protein
MGTVHFFPKAREQYAQQLRNWNTDAARAVCVDADDVGKVITGASNASPISITALSHGFATDDWVLIFGVLGNTAANGLWRVTNTGANTFTLQGSTGNGAYTSGGYAFNMTANQFLSNIGAGARISTSAPLTGKTSTLGAFDCDDPSWTGVTGDEFELILFYYDSGVEATSTLLIAMAGQVGMPFTPSSGGNLALQLDNGPNKIAVL